VYAVEVVLDNSERRIPVDTAELTVRKSYNTATDREDYHLNGKHIREKELFNLFESGGFSLNSQSQF
jgi:chromosome segregation ATPase